MQRHPLAESRPTDASFEASLLEICCHSSHRRAQMKSIMVLTRSKIKRSKTTFSVTCCLFLCNNCSLDLKYKCFRAGNGSSDCIYEVYSTEMVEDDNGYHHITIALKVTSIL